MTGPEVEPTRSRPPSWRREALRTNLWLVPAALVGVVVLLFLVTYNLDQAAARHRFGLPWWLTAGTASAGQATLTAIAAAVITVVGVVFSITILALTLASQQFGPRMLRNFIRDVGNQLTLGVFVATFVYAVLALGAIKSGPGGEFVPNISITVSLLLSFVDIVVLIYFIDHIAKTIQLPEVIAGIARDLSKAIDDEFPTVARVTGTADAGGMPAELADLHGSLDSAGVTVPAPVSGYLQYVGYGKLVAIAETEQAVIRLAHRPGHFVVAGRPLATVWPPERAPRVGAALAKAHITGPHRTLMQDPVFAIDQLAEIAIRALSSAVNDTFTALTCIDWIADGLCKISGRELSEGIYRDRGGEIRLIEFDPSYERMVNRGFDKIRQAARGMPAVLIRMMTGLGHVTEYTVSRSQRTVLARQADMVMRACDETVPDEEDRRDVRTRYDALQSVREQLDAGAMAPRLRP
ncbi:MAG TPA: DUF2254 domain-containing protein [Acidimicrobiales bacterium]|nr:DUF2254 domain-containing protein [Acidimicrobiales bacterium]